MKMSVLPKDWKLVNFSDLTEERLIGLVRGSKEQNELKEFNYIKMDSILKDGGLNLNLATRVDANQNEVDRYSLKKGDFLFNTRNSYELVGKTAVFDLDEENWLYNNNIMRIRFKEDVNPYFMNLAFHSPIVLKQLDTAKNKTTSVCAIYDYQLKNIKIPLPPIAEQKRIAAILDKADAIRRKRQEAIKLTEELGRSLFLDMFGDPVTNPKGWEIKTLEEVTTKITDGVHAKPNYTEKGIPFISVKDITTGKLIFDQCKFISLEDHLKYTKRCKPEFGDVLYTKVGATYGRPALINVKDEFSIYVSVALLKPKREIINPEFLKEVLATSAVKRQADKSIKGIGVPDLHLNMIKQFLIPIPNLKIQNKFLTKIQKVNQCISKLELHFFESENLFNSLLQKAFKGEL